MTLLAYLIKVIVVSAIFFGYYRFFLRNKRFHHYNRFFLLSSLLLSVVLPFIRIPLLYEPENPVNEAMYRTVSVINMGYPEDDISIAEPAALNESVFTLLNSIYLLYAVGVLFLLTLVVKSLLYIRSLRRRYAAEKITSLKFYNTREPGTPFSFFRSVFWNDQLSFNSHEGQQIFRHELFHVKHQHSADRLLAELLTALFWFNPFFHLIKKELKAIHEFLADQFAVSGSDRYAYATLLVQQALESGKHTVTNHFFQNHIKRRIAMITQFKQSRYGYWSRVMILPVLLIIFCFVSLYAQKPAKITAPKNAHLPAESQAAVVAVSETEPMVINISDTIPEKEAREKELQKIRQEYMEQLKLKMIEREQVLKKAQQEELENLRKQMTEQELMTREQEQNRKINTEKLMLLKKELQNRQNELENERRVQLDELQKVMREEEKKLQDQPNIQGQHEEQMEIVKKKMREIEIDMKSRQEAHKEMLKEKMRELEIRSNEQMQISKMKEDELRNMKIKVKERENELKRERQMELERYKEELKKQEDRERKQPQKEESSFQRPSKLFNQSIKRLNQPSKLFNQSSNLFLQKDSLLTNVVRQYLRDIRYPQSAISKNAEGIVYFSIAIDKDGRINNFKTYNHRPDAKPIQDLVMVATTPVAVSEQELSQEEKDKIFMSEVARTTDRISGKIKHPAERVYYFKAVFRFDKPRDGSIILTKNTKFNFENNFVENRDYHRVLKQDTIPGRAARKAKQAKLAKKSTDYRSEKKWREADRPRKAVPAKNYRGEKARPAERAELSKRHDREREKQAIDKRQKMQRKQTLAKKTDRTREIRAKKLKEKPRHKIKDDPKKDDRLNQVPDQQESEYYTGISVTGK